VATLLAHRRYSPLARTSSHDAGHLLVSWRMPTTELTVGFINPTDRPERKNDPPDPLLPAGIKTISTTIGLHQGTIEEFRGALGAIEDKVRELAGMKVDLIHPGGAPPFMVHGAKREREVLDAWQQRYGVPLITSGTAQTAAMRALGVTKFVGLTYFPPELNDLFASYFGECGFGVLAMEGVDVPFADVPSLPPERIFEQACAAVEAHPEAEAVYMLGSAWRILALIDPLEQKLQLPIIAAPPVRAWAIRRQLGINESLPGYGRLLAEML